MKKVLVLEDEENIREFEVINLRRAGYEVAETDNGDRALELYEQSDGNFDIAILDIMTNGLDGLSVCKRLREQNNSIGIILLTAKTQELDKVRGLTEGADDYITKPFGPSELIARVDALYRRVAMQSKKNAEKEKDAICCGHFELDTHHRELKKDGVRVDLTQIEFQIVEYLLLHRGIPLSRRKILTSIWGENYVGEEKIVDVNIRRIRMKIEENPSAPDCILTAWGQGYVWNATPHR